MLKPIHDFAKDKRDELLKEIIKKQGNGAGKPIPRTRKKNIEKAKNTGSEGKKDD
ncbi:MAG: hypothetical protein J6O17_09125 [Eubacterium sp.]|nr:hypothetical protein [Eubacterium sp.]